MNKEHLFGAPPAYIPVASGESERDRRLRLRAEERARKLAGNDGSVYEANESSKRDQIWEMKKMQRLGGGEFSHLDPPPVANPYTPVLQNPYENMYKEPPGKYEPPYKKFTENYNEGVNMPLEYRNVEMPSAQLVNDFQELKVTKDQLDYADGVFNDLIKKQEPDKKRVYAEELKRQIEEKNLRKGPESFEQGFEIGSRNRLADRNRYAGELESQAQAKRPNSIEAPISAVFGGGGNSAMSEREKKLKYARDLEAQIKQKKQEGLSNRPMTEEYHAFPGSQDSGRDKKRNYAQELDSQVRAKTNAKAIDLPRYPEPDYQQRAMYEERSEVNYRKNNEEPNTPFVPSGMSAADLDKKARYRQELESQIEEQKRRKEEEKRKRRFEEETAEKRFYNDAKIDPMKPIIRQKTVDPNKPSEDNPQAERYKEFLQKAKSPPEAILNTEEAPRFSSNPTSTKSEHRNLIEYPEMRRDPSYRPSDFQPKEVLRPYPEMQRPFFDPNLPYAEMQNPHYEVPKPNPMQGHPYYPVNEGERNFKNVGNQIVDPRKPEYPIPNHLIETYMREIQETRLERDRAREQCLEMREMMLREKEKNLEQLLFLVKNQTGDSRPISYQESRAPEKPSPYSAYGYKNTPTIESRKDLISEPPKTLIEEYKPQNSNIYNDLYKDFKPDLYRNMFEQPELIDINPLNPPVPEEPDPFERSLAGKSKWVDLSQAKWGAVSLIESVAVDSNNEEQVRKKWQQVESQENFLNSKPSDQTPRFCLAKFPGSLSQIVVDDESLPSHIDHVPYFPSKRDSSEELEKPSPGNLSIDEGHYSIHEEFEPSEEEGNSSAIQDKEVEQTHEITMSNPKYEETDQYMIECDEWSESQSEAEVEIKRQVKNSYDRPKIIDVFKEKAFGKVDSAKESPKKSPKKELAPNPSHGKIAFSRLEQARKHAKELKAKDVGDDVESSQAMFLDLPDFYRESVSQSSFEGKFTQKALNDLRSQKKKNNEMNSSKASLPIDSNDLHAKFFAAAYERDKGEEKALPKIQSRRYID